jgi:hypothetical protein
VNRAIRRDVDDIGVAGDNSGNSLCWKGEELGADQAQVGRAGQWLRRAGMSIGVCVGVSSRVNETDFSGGWRPAELHNHVDHYVGIAGNGIAGIGNKIRQIGGYVIAALALAKAE